MKKNSTLVLPLAMAASMALQPVNAAVKTPLVKPFAGSPVAIHRVGQLTQVQKQLEKNGFAMPVARYAAPQVDDTPVGSSTSAGFGWVDGPDGTQWYYTQNFEKNSSGGYSKSTITVFDSSNKQVGQFDVDVEDGLSVNSIDLYGAITKKMFDRDDSSYEAIVQLHVTGNASNNYRSTYYTRAYHIDGSGMVYQTQGSGMFFDGSHGWNSYQRLILVNDVVNDDESETIKLDIIAPPGWGATEPSVEHTFNIDFDLWNYSMGSYLNCYVVDGNPYYVIAKYEKPFVSGYDEETYDMIVNPDNKFVLTTYNRYYEQVDSLAMPIETPSGKLYRFGAFGLMSADDLSKNYFSDSDNLDYVVTWVDYDNATDGNTYDFAVYNHDGEKLKDICTNAVSDQWFTLNPINGKSEQMAFVRTNDEGNQEVALVDIPSCENVLTMPAEINGDAITSTLDRYPSDKNEQGYQYVINMKNASTDFDDNVIARLGWYNPDLSLDHYTRLNLGPEGEYFTPYINYLSLNPYLFDTDNEMEYIYIAKKRRTDGSNKIDNVLEVAKEDGTIVRSYRGDDTNRFRTASIVPMTDTRTQLLVAYYNDDTEDWNMNFYDLPFTKFAAGGDGTKKNPYLVATAGDLMQINNAPAANYKMVDDINLGNLSWSPLQTFSGSLDGDNHTLFNLSVKTDESQVGLFKSLGEKANVSNLQFAAPRIHAVEDNQYVGVVAGEAVTDTLNNVHVYDALIDADEAASPTIGGLIGNACLMTTIANSSFEGTMNVKNGYNMGGIVGEARTSADIHNCYADLAAEGESYVGGIAGNIDGDSKLTDCRADVDIKAGNNIGGIVANSQRGPVTRCVATGTITATERGWTGYSAAGIVGKLQGLWGDDGTSAKVVSHCFSNVKLTTVKDEDDSENTEEDTTVHDIVGWTIANDWYDEGDEVQTEKALLSNYTSNNTSATDANGIDGKYVSQAEATRQFFEGETYVYGDNADAPWKESNLDGDFAPMLFYANEAKAIQLSRSSVSLVEDDMSYIEAYVYGLKDAEFSVESSDEEVAEAYEVVVDDADNENVGYAAIQIKAKKIGTATITVKSGNLSAVCLVTVTPVDAIHDAATDATSVSTVYYDLSGRKVNAPKNGLFIIKTIMSDGTTKTRKAIVK